MAGKITSDSSMTVKKKFLLLCLLLAAATLITFWQVGNHEFINLDDEVYITANPHIQDGITIQGLLGAFSTGHAANWHPLTWISHMLDVQFFGLNPHGHHATSLLLHVVNALLLFFVLHRMTKALWQSAFVAALFALHPLHVESVAWVAERKDVLSTLFWMLTLAAYSYYVENPRFKTYLPVFVFLALGLMAKPMLVTLPFVLLLLDYWPLGRCRKNKPAQPAPARITAPASVRTKKRKSAAGQPPKIIVENPKPAVHEIQWPLIRPLVLEKIPLFALTALSCAATFIAQQKGSAVAPLEIYTAGMRISNAFVSYLLYIAKTIRPVDLAVLYPHPGLLPLWQVSGAVLCLGTITFAVIRAAKRFPCLPVGWFWFTGTLIPVIGLVQVGNQALADRYTYVPLIGLFVMAAWGIPKIAGKWRRGKEVLAAASALCLLCLVILTHVQVGWWRDNFTLYDHALSVTKNNWTIHYNRGNALFLRGDYAKAIEDFSRTVEIHPRYANAYYNRGVSCQSIGKYRQAIDDYSKTVGIDPEYVGAYLNRSIIYAKIGDYMKSINDLETVIKLDPSNTGAFLQMGLSYGEAGDMKNSIGAFTKLIDIDPKYIDAYINRGIAYSQIGDQPKAIDDFSMAININPSNINAYSHRAVAYLMLEDHAKAIGDFTSAINLDPKSFNTYLNRGIAYAKTGDLTNAIDDFSRAIALNPGYPKAYFNRGMACENLGRKTQALEDLKAAARLGSEDAVKVLKGRGLDW